MEKAQKEEEERKRKLQQTRPPEVKPSSPFTSSNKAPPETTNKLVSLPYKNEFTPEPLRLGLKEKPKHLKNSEHLFNEHFKDEL